MPVNYPFGHVIGEYLYCGSELNIPADATAGELSCPPLANPSWPVPDDPPLMVCAHPVVDRSEVSAWGPLVRPVTQENVDPLRDIEWTGASPQLLLKGMCRLLVDESQQSAWGPVVRPYCPIGCKYEDGVITDNIRNLPILNDRQYIKHSKLNGCVEPQFSSAWGALLVWRGNTHCDRFRADLPEPWHRHLGGPMIVELFGARCAYCPVMLWSVNQPCLDSSRPWWGTGRCGVAHSELRYDWCGLPAYINVGEPTCIPFDAEHAPEDYHCNCDVTGSVGDPSFGPHHCESCVVHNMLGFLTGYILYSTDALRKIPMIPSYLFEDASDPCNSECGRWGWKMWAPLGASSLEIPNFMFGDPDAELTIIAGPPDPNNLNPCPHILYAAQPQPFFTTCTGWCGASLERCGYPVETACTTTHAFRWRKNDNKNRIAEAYVCFKQHELCDPILYPESNACPSNPIQGDPFNYHNPYSTTMVEVRAHIRIALAFDHWAPRGSHGGGCCLGSHSAPPDNIVFVYLTGEFCGVIPFGSLFDSDWPGFPVNPSYPGVYPTNMPGGGSPGTHCAAMFVHQGRVDDYADAEPCFPAEECIPKRCPNWVGGGTQYPKFWCPPSLQWTWSLGAINDSPNWGPIDQPNQHQRGNQCWAVEPLETHSGGCPTGTGNPQLPTDTDCTDPMCRRGCSMQDDSWQLFRTPCEGEDGYRFRATPWGCGQCQDVYPEPP